jgi:DNA-binding transcriptional LysR family regulator
MDTLTRMRAFIDVVEAEGFSAAARKIGRSKALLSKYVRELEDELGALLLNRTTRQFSLTEAGHVYYKRASEIVREIDSLADAVRESSADLRGRIKVTASRSFAYSPVCQSMIDFSAEHPEITIEISLDDRFVDLVEEGFDLAIRITRLEDSSLIARQLASLGIHVCASPALLARYGTPQHPQELAKLPCVIDTNGRWRANWTFVGENGEPLTVAVPPRLEVNSPITIRAAAVSGLGFAMLPDFVAQPELDSGRLVRVLENWTLRGGGIYAVYPHRRYLPARIRVLVDYLVRWFREHGQA